MNELIARFSAPPTTIRSTCPLLADQIHGAKFKVHHDALLTATRQLLGPGERRDDVWIWPLTS